MPPALLRPSQPICTSEDAQTNAEDRKARRSKMHYYETWAQVGDRYDKAMTEFYWEAPKISALSPGYADPLECPHDFDTIKSAGDAHICSNCGERSKSPDTVGHKKTLLGMVV